MDPNATLKAIGLAWVMSDNDTMRELGEDLHEWIAKGGFEPDWSANTHNTWVYNEILGYQD